MRRYRGGRDIGVCGGLSGDPPKGDSLATCARRPKGRRARMVASNQGWMTLISVRPVAELPSTATTRTVITLLPAVA